MRSARPPPITGPGLPQATVVDSLQTIVWELDVATFRFTYVSPQAEAILGYPLSEWFDTPNAWVRHLHPDDREAAIEYCRAETQAHRYHTFQFRLIAADGRVVWMRDMVTVLVKDGAASTLRGVMVDVTEARETEERLRESERRLKEALRIGSMGYWELSLPDLQVYWSDEVFQLFERDPARPPALEEIVDVYVAAEDRQRVRELLERTITTGVPVPAVDARVDLPSRRRATYATAIWPVKDASGRVVKLTGVIQDITARKGVEERLRESERRLELALEGAELGLWDFDLHTQQVKYSEDLPAFLGYRPGEVPRTAEAWALLVHPDDLPGAFKAWNDHLEGRADAYKEEFRLRSRDGGWKWIQVRGKIVERDADGRPLRLSGTDLDITERKEAENALRESEARFRAAFEQAAVGMAHFAESGHCIRANSKFAELLGYRVEELIGKHYSDLTHPDDVSRVAAALARMVRGETEAIQLEKRYRRRDDACFWGQTTLSCTRDPKGAIAYFNIVCIDITARKEGDRRLREMQNQLRLATSIAEVGFWAHDLKTNEVYLSREWKRHLGYQDEELPNRYEEWASRLHPQDRDWVVQRVRRIVEQRQTEHQQFEYRMRHKDGSYRWVVSRLVPQLDESGEVVKLLGTHMDVTDRKEVEEKIRQASQHDPLTTLPNRALIYEFGEHLLAAAERSGERAAILFIDLDRFKPINDTYGHGVGDRVLKEVARRLGECVRTEDLVGRLGGDEFLVVLSRIRTDGDPARVAQNLLAALDPPYEVDGLELRVSPSIGISLYPQDGKGIDELIKNADTAMFHAKESGRNNYQFFRPELNERVTEALRIENRLKRGLDRQEFVLHYQPVVDTQSEAVVGAEALLRWPAMHIGPDRFIPVAETAGFISFLGEWVLREACRQQQEWRSRGLPDFPVAVNVSATQFRQKGFLGSVCQAIQDGAIHPSDLQVEVTESAVMKNVEEAAATLHSLRHLGVRVALDDFGTGYSSLSYLRWLPIDILKVDQSFVRNLAKDPASLAIADAIIALGDSLGLEIVAEGIESRDTADILKTRHCRRGQGFHYGRPMPAGEFEAWCRSHASH